MCVIACVSMYRVNYYTCFNNYVADHFCYNYYVLDNTVESQNKGHVGTSHFVLCREVVLSLEVEMGKWTFGNWDLKKYGSTISGSTVLHYMYMYCIVQWTIQYMYIRTYICLLLIISWCVAVITITCNFHVHLVSF